MQTFELLYERPDILDTRTQPMTDCRLLVIANIQKRLDQFTVDKPVGLRGLSNIILECSVGIEIDALIGLQSFPETRL